MVLWFIVAVISIGLMPFVAPMQFVIFIPPLAFFSVNFFLLMKRYLLSEILFIVVFLTVAFFRYQSSLLEKPILLNQSVRLENLRTKKALLPSEITQQKILVIGDDEGEYSNNFPATPYINWELARKDFENLNSYESVISIFDKFVADPPTYIIDKEQMMPELFTRLPEIGKQYQKTGWKGIYKRIAPSYAKSK